MFGSLGCCSCRVCVCLCVCRGCGSLSVCVCVCVCVWPVDLFTCAASGWRSKPNLRSASDVKGDQSGSYCSTKPKGP